MGLDNGIVMKKITRNQLDKIPDFIKYELKFYLSRRIF